MPVFVVLVSVCVCCVCFSFVRFSPQSCRVCSSRVSIASPSRPAAHARCIPGSGPSVGPSANRVPSFPLCSSPIACCAPVRTPEIRARAGRLVAGGGSVELGNAAAGPARRQPPWQGSGPAEGVARAAEGSGLSANVHLDYVKRYVHNQPARATRRAPDKEIGQSRCSERACVCVPNSWSARACWMERAGCRGGAISEEPRPAQRAPRRSGRRVRV